MLDNFDAVVQALHQGDVIAYPTEGVFGVGCDPDNLSAIEKLLQLQAAPNRKGANFDCGELSTIIALH